MAGDLKVNRGREEGEITPILTFPHRGGREKMDSGFRRNDGYAKVSMTGEEERGGGDGVDSMDRCRLA